tara:strand:+ start:216 stop:362 length:147 start_codon:yes stop_codon:yes gene_type:complete
MIYYRNKELDKASKQFETILLNDPDSPWIEEVKKWSKKIKGNKQTIKL